VLVLGSGGVTGAAWQLGVLEGLRSSEGTPGLPNARPARKPSLSLSEGHDHATEPGDERSLSLSKGRPDAAEPGLLTGLWPGTDPPSGAAPDLVVGTSAGALLGALLLAGESPAAIAAAFAGLPAAPPLRPGALARLLAAQLPRDRARAVVRLGAWSHRVATPAATAWQAALTAPLAGRDWPATLLVVTCDARTGLPVLLRADSGVPLTLAVAASCALPGVLPPVRVGERVLFDGGLRSPANVDLAGSAEPDLILALAPLTGSLRAARRPAVQARRLTRPETGAAPRPTPGRIVLVEPDLPSRRAIGVDVMSASRWQAAFEAGHRQGQRAAASVPPDDRRTTPAGRSPRA
jgi:NTE family protein